MNGIMHRDIKPANILLKDKPYLIDFGISLFNNFMSDDKVVYTEWYRGPEFYDNKDIVYDSKADVWALGMSLFEIAIGKTIIPYIGHKRKKEIDIFYDSVSDMINNKKNCTNTVYTLFLSMLKMINPLLFDLIIKMTRRKPEDRFSISECLGHVYLLEFSLEKPSVKITADYPDYHTRHITQTQHIDNLYYIFINKHRYIENDLLLNVTVNTLFIYYQLQKSWHNQKTLRYCLNISTKLLIDNIDGENYQQLKSNAYRELEVIKLVHNNIICIKNKHLESDIDAYMYICNWPKVINNFSKSNCDDELKFFFKLICI
jgi:serine/threonine protein kinase